MGTRLRVNESVLYQAYPHSLFEIIMWRHTDRPAYYREPRNTMRPRGNIIPISKFNSYISFQMQKDTKEIHCERERVKILEMKLSYHEKCQTANF